MQDDYVEELRRKHRANVLAATIVGTIGFVIVAALLLVHAIGRSL